MRFIAPLTVLAVTVDVPDVSEGLDPVDAAYNDLVDQISKAHTARSERVMLRPRDLVRLFRAVDRFRKAIHEDTSSPAVNSFLRELLASGVGTVSAQGRAYLSSVGEAKIGTGSP